MLIPIPMKQLPRPDVSVVADTNTGHLLSLFARTLHARNPLITAPPENSLVWQAAGQPEKADELLATLSQAIDDPFFLRIKTGELTGKNPAQQAPINQAWLIAVVNMGMSGLLNYPRSHLKEISSLREAVAQLADTAGANMTISPTLPLAEALSTDPIRVPFVQTVLSMNYENIVRSGLFERPTPTENTVEKAPFGIIERGLLLATMMKALSIQTVLLRVRPVLRYLRTEASRIRLREELIPSSLEYWEALIDRVTAMPVHPWIAYAERSTLPMNRKTPWGDSTPTVLLERAFIRSPWDGSGDPSAAERQAFAETIRDHIDPVVLLDRFGPILKDLRRVMDDIEEAGRFGRIASVLGFTTPGGPLNIPLWGDAFKPVFLDGINATSAISDIAELTFQIHLPAQGGTRTPWVGEEAFSMYTGAARLDSTASEWSEYVGSIAVAPEDVIVDSAFYTARFSPAMFRFVKDDYRGDLSSMMFPATFESVADVIGKKVPALMLEVKNNPAAWAHIFEPVYEKDGRAPSSYKPTRPNENLFYSDRTMMTWLANVDLPRFGAPSVMWAQRRGRAITAMPVMARFVRDREVPTATVPMASAITKLEDLAISAQLKGVR